MTVSGDPPYSWVDGTSLAGGPIVKSQHYCEAMQALTNRADNVSVAIANWNAYNADGTVKQNLGQNPLDDDLKDYKGFRHVNQIAQLRTALEAVCVEYYDGDGDPYTIASLLTDAVSRADYNRSLAELQALAWLDDESITEIFKCIDLLTRGLTTKYCTADTYIYLLNADTNYGSETTAVIDATAPFTRQIFMNFANLPYSACTKATMYIYISVMPGSDQKLSASTLDDTWEELVITWNNSPDGVTPYSLDCLEGEPLNNYKIPHTGDPGWYSFDVTSLVQDANAARGFAFYNAEITIRTKEYGGSEVYKPYIEVIQ